MHGLQNTFVGGLDAITPDTQIADNSYYYLINARQRLGSIKPNKKPAKVTTIPVGLKQGTISLGNILISFISGKAYFNVDESQYWFKIPSFLMSTTIERFYSIAVPEGKVNYIRKLNPDENISSLLIKSYDFEIQGTPASILVQDGVNQPWVIEYDPVTGLFSSRETNNYNDWTNADREYVPIGKQMMLVDSKLYIVEPNSKFIYQSISGRYLDFMVNVDINGNKLNTESQGGAASVSFNFDSDDITAIVPASNPSSFLYCTARFVRIIALDYARTIFGEPTYFVSSGPIEVGVVNQDSVVSILGDTALIDEEGVKSFNSVTQLEFEGNNSIFSLQLAKLLDGVKQTSCRAISFNNYAIFDLDTRKGRLMAIYDMLLEKWVALDITEVFKVKQFTIVKTTSGQKLYAINTKDELFQLYASDDTEIAQLYTKSFIALGDNEYMAQKSEFFKTFFNGGSENGIATVIELIDGQIGQRLNKNLSDNLAGISFPIQLPIIFGNKPTCEPITFNLTNGRKGYKIAYIVQWNTDAELQAIEMKTSNDTPIVAGKQAERILTHA